ncbi:hypothetical protein PFISCL1PPCAC_12747, partial [Pristionchus fissidentatus]
AHTIVSIDSLCRVLFTFPMLDSDENTRKCLICATPTSSIHFGIEACRACSAFFKRAILSGRKYPCRQIQRNCVIAKNDKFACRRCRFERCVAVGMIYDGPLRSSKKTPPPIQPSCSDFAFKPSTSNESLLERVTKRYQTCFERRYESEVAFLRNCPSAVRLPHPEQELYSTNFDVAMITFNATMAEMWRFFESAFPTIAQLPFAEKRALFRSYLPRFSTLEGSFRTMRFWGSKTKYSMCSLLICMDLESIDELIAAHEGGENRNTMIDALRLYVDDQLSMIEPAMRAARINETELHALFVLLICDTDLTTDISEAVLASLDAIRSEVLADLHTYYKETMRLIDYSSRLGNLMTICYTLQECNSLLREHFRMQLTLFDLHATET